MPLGQSASTRTVLPAPLAALPLARSNALISLMSCIVAAGSEVLRESAGTGQQQLPWWLQGAPARSGRLLPHSQHAAFNCHESLKGHHAISMHFIIGTLE